MLTRYDGGKNQAGVWQRIISLMPPHRVYVEPFLGSGAILRRKLPAAVNVGIDIDARVTSSFESLNGGRFIILQTDALAWMSNTTALDEDALVYADPPYLMSTRTDKRRLYKHEFSSEANHERLLAILKRTSARVIISGYPSPLYDDSLSSWQRRTWTVTKRSGERATECVWFNYEQPDELHDYRFIGRDFHDRTRIWRKLHRWQKKLRELPTVERNALLAGILTPETALRTREHR